MKRIFSILILISIFSFGCKKQTETDKSEQVISFQSKDIPKATKLSELMGSVKLIPLETKDECLVGYPMQIEFCADLIFLMEYPASSGIRVFSKEGKYLRSIGKLGKGPREFAELISFSLLSDERRIYLNDRGSRKIIEFDFDGTFISERTVDSRFGDIRFVNENKYYLSFPAEYHLKSIDDVKKDTIDYILHTSDYVQYGPAFDTQADRSHLYSPSYHDSVYRIRGDELILEYAFDFGPESCSAQEVQAEYRKTGRMGYPPGRIMLTSPFFELGNFFHFRIFTDKNDPQYSIYPCLWDRRNQSLIYLDDDSDDILFAGSEIECITTENKWVSVVDPIDLIENQDKIKSNNSFSYSKTLTMQIGELSEEDNPVLAVYTFKSETR